MRGPVRVTLRFEDMVAEARKAADLRAGLIAATPGVDIPTTQIEAHLRAADLLARAELDSIQRGIRAARTAQAAKAPPWKRKTPEQVAAFAEAEARVETLKARRAEVLSWMRTKSGRL